MMRDRKSFYSYLRSANCPLFGKALSQRQVSGMEPLLDAMEDYPLQHAAHVLAEVYHETGGGMYPVKETVFSYHTNKNPSDATVKARLNRAYDKGQLPWVKSRYWSDGWFGRGQIQITHESNYRKASSIVGADLVANPTKALEPAVSSVIAAEGCRVGMFRGNKLSDYDLPDGGYDHRAARNIVNGDTHVKGDEIAAHAGHFVQALRAAGWSKSMGKPEAKPKEPVTPTGNAKGGIIAVVLAILAAIAAKFADLF